MLVLSRTRDERIVIDDNIVITVTDIRGDKVRIGIDAPADVPIFRWELWRQMQQESSDGRPARSRVLKEFSSYGTPAAAQAHLARVLRDLGWPLDGPAPLDEALSLPVEQSATAE